MKDLSDIYEASIVKFSELQAKKAVAVLHIAKLFKHDLNNDKNDIFFGVHGYILTMVVDSSRLSISDLKQLVKIGIRWVEGSDETISIAF